MAWYKTGTVAITSGQTSVTGTGTKFATNSRVGDGFNGPDGKWYEITNITSETVLAIFPAYAGATVTASATWVIAPLQGYNKDSADKLRAITDSLPTSLDGKQDKNGNLTALSALSGAADRMFYFTSGSAMALAPYTAKARALMARTDNAGMRSEIGAAASGANSDITSLTGLTTALSVAQGGTGGNSQATARTALGVDVTLASAILDPQTAGGLMSLTTVSGFTVCKFANGQLFLSGPVTSPSIAANINATFDATIPSVFNAAFPVSAYCSVAPSSSNDVGGTNSYLASLTAIRVYIRNGSTAQTFTGTVNAQGRWK